MGHKELMLILSPVQLQEFANLPRRLTEHRQQSVCSCHYPKGEKHMGASGQERLEEQY